MTLFNSNTTWAVIVVCLSTLLYVQSLQSHIKTQSQTITANQTTISDLNKDVVRIELELSLAEEMVELATVQKEELDKVTTIIETVKVQQKKKVATMTPEQRTDGEEIYAAWDFYELATSDDRPPVI